MPIIVRTAKGTVTGLWGSALVRGADGKMRALKLGDVVIRGDVILTTPDGIVQLTPADEAAPRLAVPAAEIDRVITALNQGDAGAAPAAGLTGGDGDALGPGLRVDRIVEGVTPAGLVLPQIEGTVRLDVAGTTAPEEQLGEPSIGATSTAISAIEKGPGVNLGLGLPVGAPASAPVTVKEVPVIGQVQMADGSVVSAGTVLSAADLPGLKYVPPSDYNGTAHIGDFVYTVTSGTLSATGTASISVTPVNDMPLATSTSVTGLEDSTLPVSLTGQDPDGTVTKVTVTSIPPGSSLLLADGVTPVVVGQDLTPAQAGSLLFKPAPDFNGASGINFTVTDNSGAPSVPATVNINVTAVNDAPLALPDVATGREDTPINGNLLANDQDVDGDTLAVTGFSVGGSSYAPGATATLPGFGTLVVNANGSFTFVPVPNYNGPVPVATYTASDGTLTATSTLTLSVTPVNDPPVAGGDLASTPINTAVTVPVLANDRDPDGDPLTVSSPRLANPAQGTVSVNPDGSLSFVPATNFAGPVTITYTLSDPNGGSTTATVAINVGNNTPPDSADKSVTTAEDTPYTLQSGDFAFSDADAGQTLNAIRIDTLPASGVLLLNGAAIVAGTLVTPADIAAGKLTFAPAANGNGAPYASFTFSVQDSGGAFDTAPNRITLSVTPINDPPLAVGDVVSTDEDTPVTLSASALLGNDSDTDGDPLTIVSVQAPVNGTVALVGGNVVFTPASDYNGPASFTYTVSDGKGGTSTATVNVTVNPVVDPTISVSDITVNEAAGTATFLVSLSQPTTATVSVAYATSDGSAIAGADYTTGTGTLTFAPGVTSQTITVPITNDAVFEGSETFSVNLSSPTNATIADGVGLGTIKDDGSGVGGTDNDTPSLGITAGNVVEGSPAEFTVTLSNPSTSAVVFTPSLNSGSAGVGTDTASLSALELSTDGGVTWLPATGNVTIPAGSTSVQLRLPTTDDALLESSETFSLMATPVSGATPVPATATATIIDNDGTPTLFINDVTVNEAAGTATFTVTLSAPAGVPVTVGYDTSNGTAAAGSDYTAGSGTLTFAPGVTTQTVTVPIINDSVFEGNETFNVNLTAPTNATLADALGVGTIADDGTGAGGTDNDTPRVASVSSPTVVEGNNLDFSVTLSNASTTPTTVALTPASGSALLGTDTAPALVSFDGGATFAPVAGPTVSVPAGATSFIVRVPTIDDAISESSENLTLAASTPANAAPVLGTGTITDNDGTPTLSIAGPVTLNEAAGTATFTVSLSGASSLPVTVNFGTANGSATAGTDYAAATGTLTFAPGVTSQTVTVAIVNDSLFEGPETFSVVLSSPANAAIATGTATTTITDDGTGAGGTDNDTPQVASVSSATVVEGNNLDFSVTLSNASTTPTAVTLTPASGSATLGTDTNPALVSFDGGATFTLVAASTVAVPAGATSFIVRVPTVNDALAEPTESMTLAASTPANAAPVLGTGTIIDNDTPVVSISGPVTYNEAAGTATYTVTLSNASSTPVTVNYASADGSATAGADYTAGSGTLTFAPGVTSQTITVAITNDAVFEGSETFTINLSAPSGATLGIASSTTTITDDGTGAGGTDNDTPALTVSSPIVGEGGGFAVFTVSLSNPSTQATTVSLGTANGTATSPADYTTALEVSTDGGTSWTPAASATIAAGATSILVRAPIVGDTIDELDETFTLTATRTAGATSNLSATGTATITDDDATPTLAINDVSVNEAAGTATFTVTLSAASGQTVTVGYNSSNGSASAGSDYTALVPGTLTFAPGVTTQTVTVPIINDSVFEGNETFNVNLTAPTNATLADALGVGTIADDGTGAGGTDNDTPRVASVSSPTVVEGNNLDFSVTLSNASTTPTTVALTPASGSALLGTDTAPALVSFDGGATFAPVAGPTVSVPAGATSFIVRVPTIDDAISESSENLTLAASTPANAAPVVGTGTITDNDGTPTLSIAGPAIVDEAAGTVTYTVTMSTPSSTPVTVSYSTADGTATAGADYTAGIGTLTFAPGVTTQTISVPINNDTLFEGSETFIVSLSAPIGATLGAASVTSQIVDDGRALPGGGTANDDTPSLSVTAAPVVEGGQAVFTVSLSNPSTGPVVFTPGLASGTAVVGTDTAAAGTLQFFDGSAWVPVAGNVTIPAGESSVQLRIVTVDDAVSEGNETFSLTATPVSGSTPAAASAVATIVDNDGAPQFSINDVNVNEGAGTITFTVSLSNPSATPTTVEYAAASGTAAVPGDVVAGTNALVGTLTFAAGVTAQTITLNVVNDTVYEGSEAFSVTLSNATAGTTIADGLGIGTIRDDGTGAGGTDNDTPALTVSSPIVGEGGGFAVFTVSLSNPNTQATTVSLGTANGTATSPADYTTALEVSTDGGTSWTPAASATIAAGATSILVRAPIVGDTIDELDETFTLTATRTAGATSNLSATGTATITDDDATPTLAINDVSVNEAAGTATFTVTLSAASGQTVTVGYNSSNGSASAGSDYTALVPGTLTFAPGVTTQTVTVAITDDTLFEGNETFNVNLVTPTNATLADALGVATIIDNDAAPTIASVSSPTVVEGADLVYNVALTNASASATTFAYTLGGGSASAADYGAPSFSNGVTLSGGILTVPAGVVAFSVTLPTVQDTLNEASETVPLTIGGTLGTGTITDNDALPTLAINDVSVNEAAGTATFTVTLSAASGQTVTVGYNSSNGSASAGSDYTALVPGTLTFAPGVTTQTVTVAITDDTLFEGNETFNVNLVTPTNATLADALGVATIIDNDAAPTIASVSSPTVVEGADLVYNVALTNASASATTFAYTLGGGSASAADYGAPSFSNGVTLSGGILTVPAGVVAFSVTLPTVQDTLNEASETVPLTIGGTLGTGTITDNDALPTLAINDVSVNEAAGTATFTVTLSAASGQTVTVGYNSSNGSASAGSDYTALVPGTLTFAPGVTTQTVTVAITDDTLFEGNETFNVNLVTPTNATLADALGVATIIDNDAAPTIASVSSPTVVEGADLVYNVALTNASASATTFAYTLGGGSASAADYGAPSFSNGVTLSGGILTVPAGVVAFSVTLPTVQDTLNEASETVPLTIGGTLGTGTITDNDALPTLAINDVSVNEAAGTATFTVTLSAASGQTVTVGYNSSNGSASAGSDYTALVPGTLTFAPGVTTQTVTVAITDDTLFEGNETFNVNLVTPTNATLADALGVATIIDNDAAPTIASVSSPTVVEGADLVYNVALTNASASATTFAYTLGGGSASAADYGAPSFSNGVTLSGGILTVPAGVVAFSVTLPTVQDTLNEASETVPLTIGGTLGTGTITDNDALPTLAINDVSVNEAAGTATFTVTLSAASGQTVTVGYNSSNGSASAGSDYTALVPGTLTFAPGVTTQTVTVAITDDTLFEGNETFNVNLVTPTNATLADALGVATIIDNDAAPTIASVSSPTVVEGADLVYNVALTNASASATTFAYTLGGGSASAADYGAPSFSNGVTLSGGILTVPAGVVAFSVTLPTVQDTLNEASETVPLTIGGTLGTGTITDNDALPTLAINDVSVNEAAGTATFTVTLSAASGQTVTVGYNSSNGSASAGSDYTALVPGTLTFAPGVTTQTVTVAITDDTLFEGNETFNVNLVTPTNATLADALGVATIIDNDAAPTIASVSSPTVVEGADLVYNVALTNASASATTFAYTLGGGSASAADYGAPSFSNGVTLSGGILTVPAGVVAFSVTLPTVQDTLNEASETVPLTIGGTLGTGTITDNDALPTLAINDVSVNEAAGTATFTVTLSAASGQTVTVGYNSSNGSASAGSDYTALVPGTLTFAPGVTTQTVTVAITDDTLFEGNETFNVNLVTPTNATLADALGVATIIDNDAAPTIASVSSPTVVEGADLVYNVALTNASASATTFAYTLGGGSASAADYGAPSFSNGVTLSGGILTVPAGVVAFSVTLPTVQDTLNEASETVPLTIGGTLGTGTITDNDALPTLAINDVSVNEAAGTATFTVTLSAASGQTVTVGYNSSNGSASAGSDYTALVPGTLTFAPGVTTQTVTVAITDDTLFEGNETFNVNLVTPTNATLADALGVATIIDNDAAPTIASVSSPTVVEGADLVYNVALTNASASATTFAYTLGGGSASAADYGAPSFSNGVTLSGGILTVPAGVVAFSVTLPTVQDTLNEASETVPLTIGGTLGTGTITDNDALPTLAINDVSVNEAAGTATFTVTLSAASGQTVTVGYNSSNGSASAGSDYTALVPGTLTFAPGVTTQTVTVAITDDTLFEGNETFNVNLVTPTNATLADALGVATIIDNDAAPTIASVSSPTVVEGADLVYNVALTNASASATTFAYTLGGGSASAADYGAPSFSNGVTLSGGILTVPAGVVAFSVTLPTVQDTLNEASETVPLTIGGTLGTGTITDNDALPTLAINDVSVNEAAGTATFTVTLSAASGQTVTVGYNSSNGSASAGSDYTALVPGTLTFAPGVTTQTVTVAITDDTLFEGNETFNVNLVTPTNATLADALGVATIIDNDAAPTIASVSSPTVVEGADLVYNVALTNASASATTFAYTLGGGSASAADYGAPSFSNGVTLSGGILTVPAGVVAFSVTLPTVQDTLNEASETVPLTIGGTLGTGTITDNDALPTLAINDVSVNEAAGTATFTVTLSAASGQTVTVGYNSSNGSASAGSDYTALVPGTLTFAPGVTTQTVTVAITDDTLFEGNETFNVNLVTPTNATLADALGVATIIDNDAAPTIASVSSPTVVEGADLVYNVALTNASASATTFAYTLGGGSASAADYGAPSFSNGVTLSGGILTVPAGVVAFSVTLPTVQDTLNEASETVPLTIGGTLGTGTITDNDALPTLAINDVSVNEAAGTATFTVTLSAASGQTVTVGYNSSNGSASAGSDYTALVPGTLTFAPGVTTQTVTVAITDDTLFEGNETFNVNLVTPTNATLADALGVATIIDNDAAPTIASVSSPTVVEGADLVYNVALTNASASATTFAYTLGGGSASAADYGAPSFSNGVTLSGGILTVPAGVVAFSVTLPTVQDTLNEASETVPLTIGGTLGTGTITDNDALPTLAINDVSVNEAAGTATFTVTLSAASGQTVTVGYNSSNGSASAGSDYTALVPGTLTFAPGVTTQTVTVAITDDTLFEGNETFNVNLVTPTNATLADALGVATIIDNDNAPVLDLDVNNSSGAAGANYVTSYTENTAAVSIADVDVSVTDVDSTNLTGATITLTNAQAGDLLAAGAMPAGITAAVVGNVVTLSGAASLASYQTAIRAVTFANTTETPSVTPRSISVVVTDGTSNSNVATTTVNVIAVNDAPLAVADVNSTAEDTPLVTNAATGVLANDTDVDGPSLSVTQFTVAGVAGTFAAGSTATIAGVGTLVINANGSYTFTPALNFNGPVPLATYTISDGSLTSSSTLALTVSPVNDAPVAAVDTATATEAGGVANGTPGSNPSGNVLTNDTDVDASDTKTVSAVSGLGAGTVGGTTAGAYGSLVLNADGSYTYSVNNALAAVQALRTAANTLTDSFTYTVRDSAGATSSTTLTVTITGTNDAPVATVDTGSATEDVTLSTTAATGVLANDTDVDAGDTKTVSAVAFGATSGTVGSALAGTYGTLTLNADGSYSYLADRPAAEALAAGQTAIEQFTYIVRDTAGATSTATLNLTVTGTNDAPVVGTASSNVSEEGLPGGIADTVGTSDTTNSATVSGTVAISDVDSAISSVTLTAPLTPITSNAVTVTWSGAGTGTLVGTAGATTIGTLTINNSGAYTFTLSGPIDHAGANVEDVKAIDFGVVVSDGSLSTTSTLTINVEDDAPPPLSPIVETLAITNTNLMIVLDVSGSMGTLDGVNGTSRLASAVQSITNLLDSYAQFGDVRVRLVTFSTHAAAQGAVWTDIATAKAQLAALTAGGGTNYDEALADAITAFGNPGQLANAQNINYFFSDGLPTYGSGTTSELVPAGQSPGTPAQNGTGTDQSGADTGIQAAEETTWTNFLGANNINSFAIGFGSGITDVTYLNPIAYDGQTGSNTNGILVANFSDLDSTLADTLPAKSASGDFVASGVLYSGSAFGADGGYVRSITIDGTTYTYNPTGTGSIAATGGTDRGSFDTTTNTLTVTTVAGGSFVVDLDHGAYAYNRPTTGVTSALVETMNFTLVDRDGDTTSSSVTANFQQAAVTYGTASGDTLNGTAAPDIILAGAGNDVVNGGAGNDALYGQDGNDTLNGEDGNDALYGGAGNDVLSGGTGNDLLVGGPGSDTLTGGTGSDTFAWTLSDRGTPGAPVTDTITDFNTVLGGDVLDLAGLLVGENAIGSTGNLQNYLDFDSTSIPGSTVIRVSSTGGFAGGTYNAAVQDQTIILSGVDLRNTLPGLTAASTDNDVIRQLVDLGKLITDGRATRVLVDDVTVNEGAGTATFTVSLTNPTDLTVTVGYSTSNGTATAGTDYTAVSGTLTFAPGVTSQSVTVAITNDTPFEVAETFNVNLTSVTNATISDNLGVGTVRDDGTGISGTDNDAPTLNVSSVTVAENVASGYAVFAISLSKTSPVTTTVDFAAVSGTASAADFNAAGMQVSTDGGATWTTGTSATFAANQTGNVSVRVPIVNDTLNEATETFSLVATTRTGAGYTLNPTATGTGSITNDDTLPTLVVNDVTVNEGAGTATFTVSLSTASGQTVTVGYNTSNGTATAGSDYTAATGTLTFAPGVTTQTITLPITDDTLNEANETFNVNLVTPTNATIADALGVGTIVDNDAPPAVTINDIVVNEATGNATFTLSLSAASGQTVTVNYNTSDGTATAGSDYTAKSGVVTFAPGVTTQTVTVAISNNNVYEGTETFNVNLASATNATIADNQGVGTIRDDGTGSGGTSDDRPTLSINSFNVAENVAGGYAAFTATLSKASGVPTTVDFATATGTAGATDFNAAGMQVSIDGGLTWASATSATFAAGQTSVQVRVPVIDDLLDENNETFSLIGSVAGGLTVNASATGVATITDNDPSPALAVSPAFAAESAGFEHFQVSLSSPSGIPISVSLATANGTATSGSDYTTALQVSTDGGTTWVTGTTATFAPETTSVLVRVPVISDATAEPDQTFTLTATRTAGATSNASASGTGTITESSTLNGGAGNDVLSGGTSAETLNGGDGNDIILGGAGNDTLGGGNGNDRLVGGVGNDNLTGGVGADVFQWTFADKGVAGAPAADIIVDFDVATPAAGGDTLDLRDLLTGENSSNLQQYLDFDTTSTPGSTIIRISSGGSFAGGTYSASAEDQRVTLQGVDLRTSLGLGVGATDNQIIAELLNRNKLITDGP